MKSKLTLLYILFVCSLFASSVVYYMGGHPTLAASLLIITLITSLLMFQSWMKYVRQLLIKTELLLDGTKKDKTGWGLGNFEKLKVNQDNIAQKFNSSAQLITGLIQPEKMAEDKEQANDSISLALSAVKTEMLKLKEEDGRREWVSQGLAMFGEILRDKQEVKKYGYQIISKLVKYLGANQGGIFIEYKNDEGRYVELIACYAYSKQKQLSKRIYEGEGLIGECMFERDIIFLTDVPENYVKITSGLGEATPRNIVVVPLIFNEIFCGVIELASFEVLQSHQLEFLKKVCSNIASEVASIKSMENTQLLLEESNSLTRELQVREEQMRENMEELANSQRVAERRQSELKSYLSAIDNTIATAEFSPEGGFRDANNIFLKVLGYGKDQLSVKYFDFLMGDDPSVIMMWENLRIGKFFSGEFKLKSKSGKELWLTGTFNPIIIEGEIIEKIMMFAQFTTQEKEKLNELGNMVKALKSTLPVLEFNERFECKTGNEMAMSLFGLTRIDLRSKTIMDFIAPHYHMMWNRNRENILGKDFSNFVVPFSIGGQDVNYEISISVNRDLQGSISKIIVLMVREALDKVSLLAVV